MMWLTFDPDAVPLWVAGAAGFLGAGLAFLTAVALWAWQERHRR